MTLQLTGYKAVVTGGALGIGLGIVEDLLLHGAEVVVADVSQENIEQMQEYLWKHELTDFHAFVGDLSDEKTVNDLHQNSLNLMGTVHILVNCAGGG